VLNKETEPFVLITQNIPAAQHHTTLRMLHGKLLNSHLHSYIVTTVFRLKFENCIVFKRKESMYV